MDKQTLSFASVFGISRDAGLAGEDYSVLGSVLLSVLVFSIFIVCPNRQYHLLASLNLSLNPFLHIFWSGFVSLYLCQSLLHVGAQP